MAATTILEILEQVRTKLIEPKPKFWSDKELIADLRLGVDDLWGAIIDLHADHYQEIDEEHVSLKSGMSKLSGVPEQCFRILLIEPRDTTVDGTGRQVIFTPRAFKHPDFVVARTRAAGDPSQIREIFYELSGVGSPIAAPTILTAPKLTADLDLRISYCRSLDMVDVNPVPGKSDGALIAWTIAHARAKEREDRMPDPGWLAKYATEKQAILVRLTPRQESEPEAVESFFQGYGSL